MDSRPARTGPHAKGMQATSGRPRSHHLGHVQVREREVELVDVRHRGADVLGRARAQRLGCRAGGHTIASRLVNVAEETARPIARSTIRLALQKPSISSKAGSVAIR